MSELIVDKITTKEIQCFKFVVGDTTTGSTRLFVADGSISTSPTTGSIVANGGLGIGGAANIGGGLSIAGASQLKGRVHIGVGTDTPVTTASSTLVISNNGPSSIAVRDSTADVEAILYANSAGVLIGSATNHSTAIRTNNLDRMIFTAAGNIGINTAAPTALLHVNGQINTTTLTASSTITANTVSLVSSPFAWDGQWPQCVMTHYNDATLYQPDYQLTDAQLPSAYTQTGHIGVLDTTITPRRASSKIRVSANITLEGHYDCVFRLYRKVVSTGVITEIGAHDWTSMPANTAANTTGGNRIQYYGHEVMPYDTDIATTPGILTLDFLDTPNTIAEIMYFIVAFSIHRTTPMAINKTYNDRNNANHSSNLEYGTSQMILQEFFA